MKKIKVCALLFIISACTTLNSETVIRPESLVNSSAEKISFPVVDNASVKTIENWLASGDAPTHAELTCANNRKVCNSVRKSLKKHKISFDEIAGVGNSGTISLMYERLIAKECKANNFGCSTATNSVNMVSNREQFTKPAVSGMQDAASALKAISKYIK